MSIFGDILHKIFHQSPPEETHHPHTTPETEPVNATAILRHWAQQSTEQLDWQHSIVDLMKLLGLDSSLAHRTMLAQELGYQGDMGDTAQMNIWLHTEVMKRLQEHGGTVPDELKQ